MEINDAEIFVVFVDVGVPLSFLFSLALYMFAASILFSDSLVPSCLLLFPQLKYDY